MSDGLPLREQSLDWIVVGVTGFPFPLGSRIALLLLLEVMVGNRMVPLEKSDATTLFFFRNDPDKIIFRARLTGAALSID